MLAAVSEKTGYPEEVLALDLDLEADLGIDTVKQAELFVAIRTQYGIARREDLRLSDYNTLAKVIALCARIRWMASSMPAAAAVSQPVAPVVAPVPEQLLRTGGCRHAPAPAQVNPAEIKAYVLAAVSEKTGYPEEVLDLELDLEADLGIDTVKQAELFAAIRTQYGIARREDLRLSDYNTLAKVIRFVEDSLVSAAYSACACPACPPGRYTGRGCQLSRYKPRLRSFQAQHEIKTYLLAAVSEKTGYPTEVLDLELDLEADLGIDTVKQAELFAAIRTQYGIARREDLRLSDYNTLAKVIHFVEDALKPVACRTGGGDQSRAAGRCCGCRS